MLNPIILSCLIFIMASCGVKKTRLSQSELKWANVYEAGDTLIFRSEKDEFDTSYIIRKNVHYPEYMPIEVHDNYLPQEGIIIYKNKNLEYHQEGMELLKISKKSPNKETRLFIDYLYSKIIVTDLTTGEAEKYKNGEIYEFDTYHPKAKPNEPKIIFWHENYGIVKYITHADIIWERINIHK
jgi:hypothetical protein